MVLDLPETDRTRGPRSGAPRRRRAAEPAHAPNRSLDRTLPECGWRVEKRVIDRDTIAGIREFLSARRGELQRRFEAWAGEGHKCPRSHEDALLQIQEYEVRGLQKDFRHYLTGELDLETRLHPALRHLLSTATLTGSLCELLSTLHYFVHYPPMVRFKVAGAYASLVPLHQDSVYNDHIRDFITVWAPLSDTTPDRGGVVLYSGSHRSSHVTHATGGTWAREALVDLSEFEVVNPEIEAGDILLFSSKLFHESATYSTDALRFSIDFRIFKAASDTTKSFYDPFTDRVTRVS